MKKFADFIKSNPNIDIILVALITLILGCLLSTHTLSPFIDHGREYFLSEEILKGKVPYKDITLIYFPFAYYINSYIFYLLGMSIKSLAITQTLFCTIFIIIYYLLCKEFLSRSISFLVSLFIITASIFSYNDIFSYIFPYSYASAYGYISFLTSAYFIIKLFKTDKMPYLYLSALFAGFSFSCKAEFSIAIIFFIIAIALYKKLKIKDYIFSVLTLSIFPLIELIILFTSGVTIQEISNAINFARAFAGTSSMKDFLSSIGMLPYDINEKLANIVRYMLNFGYLIVAGFIGLFIYKRYRLSLIIPIIAWISFIFLGHYGLLDRYFCGLPLIILFFIYVFFKKLYNKENITILVLLIFALLFSFKTFFYMLISSYGSFGLPAVILAAFTLIKNFAPKEIFTVKVKHLSIYILLMIIIFEGYQIFNFYQDTQKKIVTNKGIFYTDYLSSEIFDKIINYTNKYIKKNETILVLPEGNLVNFLTDRTVDLHCFMMDRLYNDAYGDDEARDLIKNTQSDYIFLLATNVSLFSRPYLYGKGNSPSALYIYKNYDVELMHPEDSGQLLIILKKKNKD